MLIVALVYYEKVINNLVSFWNVENRNTINKQSLIGVLKKGIMDFFWKQQKNKNLKNRQSHWQTLKYIY